MSKVRIPINPKQVGKVGAYSMYVRDGEQIVRQRQNASNYGEEASRTLAQQSRRVKWSNLVLLFKYMSEWQPRAYENLNKGQTDYNKFMSLNINSAVVALTKQQSADGAAVVAPVVVSQGSLVSPDAIAEGTHNISVGMAWGTGDTAAFATIGELSEALVQYNAGWQDGDNLAAVYFLNWLDIQGTPRCSTVYAELTLDKTNTSPLSTNSLASRMTFTSGGMGIDIAPNAADFNDTVGWAVIHTRRDSGTLKVSTERIVMVDEDILGTFITQAQLDAAIASYGLSAEVPLEPSFKKAVINSVAADGSQVLGPQGGNVSFDHGVTLTITGENMTPETVWLVHDGIPYVPLVIDGNTWTYVLGSNGVNMIWLNGVSYGRITISGVTVPEELPNRLQASRLLDGSTPVEMDKVTLANADCLNYPYRLTAEYTRFLLRIGSHDKPVDLEMSDLEIIGGTITSQTASDSKYLVYMTPLDVSKPCYLKLKGYIVFVCNYSS
jgi:hypothetical protein